MNNQQRLKELMARNEELKPIVFKSFKNSEQLSEHNKKNKTLVDEYYSNQEEIKKLKLEVMTPEERKKEEEIIRLMKLKREGGLWL